MDVLLCLSLMSLRNSTFSFSEIISMSNPSLGRDTRAIILRCSTSRSILKIHISNFTLRPSLKTKNSRKKTNKCCELCSYFLTTNGLFLWTPRLHPFITVYFHVKINKRSSISLPSFVCISLLIYTMMVFVLSDGKCVLTTPQVSAKSQQRIVFIQRFL